MKRSRSPTLPRLAQSPTQPESEWCALPAALEAEYQASLFKNKPLPLTTTRETRLQGKVLEGKRQKLPFLDTIEYIEAHLKEREAKQLIRREQEAERRKRIRKHAVALDNQAQESPRPALDEILSKRYPRFCGQLNIQDAPFARIQRLHWVLQTIEEIYDARERAVMRSLENNAKLENFAKFTFQHLRQSYGLEGLASQCGWDLIVSINLALSEWSRSKLRGAYGTILETFSNFLREVWDEHALVFFLLARKCIQERLGFQLQKENKNETLAHHEVGVAFVPHSCMLDDVYLSENAVSQAMEEFLSFLYIQDESRREKSREFLTKMVVFQWDKRRQRDIIAVDEEEDVAFTSEKKEDEEGEPILFEPVHYRSAESRRTEAIRRAKARQGPRKTRWVFVHYVLAALMENYAQVPEDIIKLVKEGDDGNRTHTLNKLKSTIPLTQRTEKLQADLQEAKKTLLSHQAKVLKLTRKCSISEENNMRFRTELFLAKNEVWRQEQVVQDLESKHHQASKQIEATWSSVIDNDPTNPSSSPKPLKKRSREERDYQTVPALLQQIPVRLFLEWLDRQTSRHSIKVQAVKKIKKLGGWREQLARKQEQAAIFIQRAFRQRKEHRVLEEKAREEAKQRRKEAFLRKKANERLRRQQEGQSDKHKARIAQRSAAEKIERERIEKMQTKIVEKHRVAEADRRLKKHQKALQGRCFRQWIKFRRLSLHHKSRTIAKKRQTWASWKEFIFLRRMILAKQIHAVTQIQRVVRGFCARRRVAGIRKARMDQEQLILYNLRRLQNATAYRCLKCWQEHSLKMKRARAFLKRNLESMLVKTMAAWKEYTRQSVQEQTQAAAKIQSIFRVRRCKQQAKLLRVKWNACIKIQNVWRGYLCKTIAARAKRMREEQELKIATSLRRIRWRRAYDTFQMWSRHTKQMKRVKVMLKSKMKDLRKATFQHWRWWTQEWKACKLKSAIRIQTRWRANATRRVFLKGLRQHRMARRIQALIRGRIARQRVEALYWAQQAAVRIQRLWRGRKGRRVFMVRLSTYILNHATPSNFQTVKFALETKHLDPRKLVDPVTGDTLLHRACSHGSKRIVKMCLRHGLRINSRNKNKENCIHSLAMGTFLGQPVFADYLLSKGVDMNVKDSQGKTALMKAASRGLFGLVEFLTTCSHVEAKDKEGRTALYLAATANQSSSVDALLQGGADLHCVNNIGMNPLHELASNGMLHMMAHLMQHYSGEGALDIPDHEGRTPLHYAVANRQIAAARMLIEWGATPNAEDSYGRNPLWFAARNMDLEMLNFLIEADCHVQSTCSTTGDNPLHAVLRVPYQRQGGVDEEEEDDDEEEEEEDVDDLSEPDDEAKNRLSVVQLLMKSGVDINQQNLQGDMPIHITCRNNDVQLVKLLVYYDCEMNVKNYAGHTPLGEARMANARGVIEFIQKRFIERDRETHWQMEERRKAEALTAFLGQVKFTKTFRGGKNTARNIEPTHETQDQDGENEEASLKSKQLSSVENALAVEQERTKHLPKLNEDEWFEVLTNRSVLEVELGTLTQCAWQKFRVFGKPVRPQGDDEKEIDSFDFWSVPRKDDELSGTSFWYNPDKLKYQWTTPAEVFDLPEAKDNWVQHWDEESGTMSFYNERTGEWRYSDASSRVAPAARGGKVLEKRVEKRTRSRRPSQVDGELAFLDEDIAELEGINLGDYRKFWEEENREIRERLEQEAAAVRIQSAFRRYNATLRAWRQRVLHRMAIRLQSKWRAFKARRDAERLRVETGAAKKIQSVYRTYAMRVWFIHEKARLEWDRWVLHCTSQLQRVWRGYLGRREARLKYAREVDPAPRRHDEWQAVVNAGTTVFVRSFRAFDEYLVRWPDVRCYQNRVTKACSWTKPDEMEQEDKREFYDLLSIVLQGFTKSEEKATLRLQCIYRGNRSRKHYLLLRRGLEIMRGAKDTYLEHPFRVETAASDKQGVVNLCNYMLYLFVIDHNIDKARHLFGNAMDFMTNRGPDNAFVLMSYACFLASTCEEDFDVIMDYVDRACVADPTMRFFERAELGFFRQATLDQPQNAKAMLNYAICLQFFGTCLTTKVKISPEYDLAEQYYIKALSLAPQDKSILENFDFMLINLKMVDYTGFMAFREFQEQQAMRNKTDEEKALQRASHKAAVTAQKFIRGFLARLEVWKTVNRVWEVWQDEASGNSFFYSKETGQSQWTAPFGLELFPGRTFDDTSNKLHAGDLALPTTWILAEDEEGNEFYFNEATGESTWELPVGFTTIALSDEWEELLTDEGEVYYANRNTGETTWDNRVVLDQTELPAFDSQVQDSVIKLAASSSSNREWEMLQDDEGNVYWYNRVSGETSWDPPGDELRVGAFVYARFHRGEHWFPGRIHEYDFSNDTYFVKYEDGDQEYGVKLEDMTIREAPDISNSTWCEIVVDEVSNIRMTGIVVSRQGPNMFSVLFDDGQEDHSVEAHRVWPIERDEETDMWTTKRSTCGLVFYVNTCVQVAQWDPPTSMKDAFEEPLNFSELFYAVDVNQDGKLTRQEIVDSIQTSRKARDLIQSESGLKMLLDPSYLNKVALLLDTNGKGYIDEQEFQSVCQGVCRDLQLEQDLRSFFHHLDADESGSVDKTELEQALYVKGLQDIVRGSPALHGLLRPSLFSVLLGKLQDQAVEEEAFVLHAKEVLHVAEDSALALRLFREEVSKQQLEDVLGNRSLAEKCFQCRRSKEKFVARCLKALEERRLRNTSRAFFRLLDDEGSHASGVLTQVLLEAMEDMHSSGTPVADFVRHCPELNMLLLHPERFQHVKDRLQQCKKTTLNVEDFLRILLA